MRKILTFAIVLAGLIVGSCTKSEEGDEDKLGSIYGIVTELSTAEPMRAMGVELYKNNKLLLKTVTYDDGHFEFKDLNPNNYQVKVVADGYEQTEEGLVSVEAGRQARIDLQVVKQTTHMVVRTIEATVNGHKATLNGEFTNESGYYPSEVGFVYSTLTNPQEGGTIVKCKVNTTFSTTLNDLGAGTYYFQAYAKNKGGTGYGELRSFKVCISPIVWTKVPTNVLSQTATLNGEIEEEGDPAYTERGFVFSKSYPYPTVDDPADATTKVTVSGRSKDFSANISSLTEDTKYYVRAYAINENETVYGSVQTFTPKATIPSVTTLEVTNILETSVTFKGRIDNPGEPSYTERGFIYSESHETPTMSDSRTSTLKVVVDGTSRDFETSISSLKNGTTYYVRAYATSSKGTSYGEVKSFTTIEEKKYVVIDGLAVQKQDLAKASWKEANSICQATRVNGFTDWRLPTEAELKILYTHRNEIGGFKSENYWSSHTSENATHNVFYTYFDFSNGISGATTEYYKSYNIRAVRTAK